MKKYVLFIVLASLQLTQARVPPFAGSSRRNLGARLARIRRQLAVLAPRMSERKKRRNKARSIMEVQLLKPENDKRMFQERREAQSNDLAARNREKSSHLKPIHSQMPRLRDSLKGFFGCS